MLVQFTLGNFKSFKERMTLSLSATNDDWREEDNLAFAFNQRLVKTAAIYGPNAGGKSNLLNAMVVFRDLIQNSSKESQKDEPIHVIPFRLHSTTENAPSFFEVVFLQSGTRYRYGFEATSKAIETEWLFKQAASIRETRLFTRDKDVISVTDAFKEGRGLENRTRPNALFLSVAAQFNGDISGEIMGWMNKFRNISGLNDAGYMNFTTNLLNDTYYGPLIRELVKAVDVGIENLEREEIAASKIPDMLPKNMPKELREMVLRNAAGAFAVKTLHQRYDAQDKPAGIVKFDLQGQESAGTEKFVALTGPFLTALREGSVLITDELEARLHPLLTKALVGLFNSSANKRNAQLIFATHDEGLLESQRIRRDQVWFVEKNQIGASCLFSLDEIKGVRKSSKFRKEYLLGQFGGVPHVNDLQEVLKHAKK